MEDVLQILVMVVLALVLLTQFVVMRRISRVERTLHSLRGIKPEETVAISPQRVTAQDKSHGHGLFETFLAEDPQRSLLTKREASAAFRDWRKQRGMTWHSPESGEDAEA